MVVKLNSLNPILQPSAPKSETLPATSHTMSCAQKLGMGALVGALMGMFNALVVAPKGQLYSEWKLAGVILKHLPIFSAESLLIRFQVLRNLAIASSLSSLGTAGLAQHVHLTLCPKAVIKKLAPGKEAIVDSTTAKVVRIALMTALYLGMILPLNGKMKPMPIGSVQLLCSTALLPHLIGGSVIKETGAGLLGTFGTHFTTHLITSILL